MCAVAPGRSCCDLILPVQPGLSSSGTYVLTNWRSHARAPVGGASPTEGDACPLSNTLAIAGRLRRGSVLCAAVPSTPGTGPTACLTKTEIALAVSWRRSATGRPLCPSDLLAVLWSIPHSARGGCSPGRRRCTHRPRCLAAHRGRLGGDQDLEAVGFLERGLPPWVGYKATPEGLHRKRSCLCSGPSMLGVWRPTGG
jgi:hypothetical protein